MLKFGTFSRAVTDRPYEWMTIGCLEFDGDSHEVLRYFLGMTRFDGTPNSNLSVSFVIHPEGTSLEKESIIMADVHVLEHPLIQHKLAILRNKETSVKEFRELVGEIAGLMCYEATRKLPTEEVAVETPVGIAKCHVLAGKKLAIVPVLRAGLGMVDNMVDLIPSAKIGHIGLYRDPETHKPVEYYCKLPEDVANRQVFVVDPMLATGGSAVAAIDFLKEHGCRNIIMMNIIGAPEGVKAVQEAHPDVEIYLAALDERLNEHAYIVPGLGDAGDRIFGTK